MSKLKCHCGAEISNSRIPSETGAYVYPEKTHEQTENDFDKSVNEYLDACSDNREKMWLSAFFGADYPTDLERTQYIADIRTKIENDYVQLASECNRCGRIYVQKTPRSSEYYCYEPKTRKYNGAFNHDA